MAKLSRNQKALWQRYIIALKDQYPTVKRVFVRTAKLPNYEYYNEGTVAITDNVKGCFKIVIDPRQGWHARVDSLLHEYAHCLDGFNGPQIEHGETWGVWLSKCYRVKVEVDERFWNEQA